MTAIADEAPVLRQGLWDYKRTVDAGGDKSQTYTTQECVDPSQGMKEQNEMMTQAGCKVSPVTRSGNVYSFTLDCVLQGITMKSKSVITVENDSAYRIDVDALHDGKTTKEVLVARRTGDC
ncbi:MAG: DUF3617 family protein [Steroidobacteraceae bacterium]